MMPEPTCRDCDHEEDNHVYSPTQATYWCGECADWCDLDMGDDGAPCCRAVVTSGDWSQHEPGCQNERAS
jgi:hypothetical protein